MRKGLAVVGLLLGTAGLLLQLLVSVPAMLDNGYSLPFALVKFFSYFTILTNILVVLVYAGATVRGHRWLAPFRRPLTRAVAATSIALVMGFYELVLADLWKPEGLFWVCDVTLHYVTPILYLIWFAIWNRSGTLTLSRLPSMLVYPMVYVVYIMVRGAIVLEYPYPVLDAGVLGYARVGANVVALIILYSIMGALALLIDRSLIWLKSR